jgi:hypothetical protein
MDVVIEDPLWKKKRAVVITWQAHPQTRMPPKAWWSQVCGEVEYQRVQDQKKKMGKWVPGM